MSHDIDDPRIRQKTRGAMARGTGADAVPRGAAGDTETRLQRKYWDHWADGSYRLRRLRPGLFKSDAKFDAGCGWPSWWKEVEAGRIERIEDHSHGMTRVECAGQLRQPPRHVFDARARAQGRALLHHSASIDFKPEG